MSKSCKNKKQNMFFETTNLLVGLPRTGKTYALMYNLIILNDSFSIYSNITSSKVGDIFDMSKFQKDLQVLHSHYISLLNKPDVNENEELKKKQIELDFFLPKDGKKESLLIIDEALNFFNKSNPAFLFLLSYASRFDIRVILVAQNAAAIHKDYLGLITVFYKMESLHKRLNTSGFLLKFFGSSSDLIYSRNVVDTINIPICQDVFELYSTPNYKTKTKNILRRFVFMLLFFSVVGAGLFWYGMERTFSSPNDEKVSNVVEKEKEVKIVKKQKKMGSLYSLYFFKDRGFFVLLEPDSLLDNQKLFSTVHVLKVLDSSFFFFLVKIKKIKIIKKTDGGVYYVKISDVDLFKSFFTFSKF